MTAGALAAGSLVAGPSAVIQWSTETADGQTDEDEKVDGVIDLSAERESSIPDSPMVIRQGLFVANQNSSLVPCPVHASSGTMLPAMGPVSVAVPPAVLVQPIYIPVFTPAPAAVRFCSNISSFVLQ